MDDQHDLVEWSIRRLQQLRGDHADGEAQLLQIERQRAHVHDVLLRLSGAIQVLEEFVSASGAFDERAPAPATT